MNLGHYNRGHSLRFPASSGQETLDRRRVRITTLWALGRHFRPRQGDRGIWLGLAPEREFQPVPEGARMEPTPRRKTTPAVETNIPQEQNQESGEGGHESPARSIDEANQPSPPKIPRVQDPPEDTWDWDPNPEITFRTKEELPAGPAPPGRCLQCRREGHQRPQCPYPVAYTFCFWCGWPHVTVGSCPKCAEKWRRRRNIPRTAQSMNWDTTALTPAYRRAALKRPYRRQR